MCNASRVVGFVGLIAALAAPGAGVQAQVFHGPTLVYTVKQQGGGLGAFIDEIVVVQALAEGSGDVWVAERRFHEDRLGKLSFKHQWIDGRTCPALVKVFDALSRLPAPTFAPPEPFTGGWMSDTPYVTVMGPPAKGQLGERIARRDLGGPISLWWRRDADKALAACWQNLPPLVDGGTVPSQLSSDEDAARAGVF
jgi:hypothetical protein